MESLSLLIAPLFLRRRLKPNLVLMAHAVATLLVLESIFYWSISPTCFVEGVGLTPFKKISEYIISVILFAAVFLLFQERDKFDPTVLKLLVASIIVTIGSELAFTFYVHAYGLSNLIGHFLKIISFYLIYKAIIETGLIRPYNLLFRNLKKSEETLERARDELEVRVKERTAELTNANEELRLGIIERERVEEVLRVSEARYQDLYENAPDMFVSVDAESARIIQCNQTLTTALGYSKEEIIGRPIFDMYHPDCMEDVRRDFRSFVETGVVDNAELQLRRKDGSRIDVSLNVSAVRDESGKILYSRSIWRDITDFKHIEKRVADLAHIFENSLNEIYIFDADSLKFLWVNRGARTNLGYSMYELKMLMPLDLKTDYTLQSFQEMIHPLISGEKELIQFETRHKRKDKSFYFVDDHLQKIAHYEGKPAFVAIILDITEQKRIEEDLEAYRQNLEEMVKERTADLEKKTGELERFNKLFVDRELRMVELKKRIGTLEKELAAKGESNRIFNKE